MASVRTSTWLRPLALLAGLQLAVHGIAWACSCAPSESVEAELATSDLVVFAEIVRIRERRLGCTMSSNDPIGVKLDVITGYVGADDGEVVDIETARSGVSCGVDFVEGETWLVYAQGGRAGLCSRTRQVDADDAELAELDALFP